MAKSSWLTVSPTSGFGNKTIQNIGTTHTGRLQRQTVVTGRAIGIATTKTYTVTQKAKAEFIMIGAESYSVAAVGGIVTISGTSNSPKLTVSVGNGGTLGTLRVNGSTATNGSAISGDPGATAQYNWSVQIQVGENLTAAQRNISVTVTGSSSSVSDTSRIVQAASVFEYTFNIAAGTASLPASGGNSAITAQLTTKRNGKVISTRAVTPTLSGSATGFSISGTTVTAANRGTTLGEARSIVVTGKFTTSETGEVLSDTVTVSQAANSRVIVYGKPTITSFEVADIPASGGSVSSGDVEYSQSRHYHYDSGQTEELSSLTSGGQVTFGDAVSVGSLGTTVKSRTIVGQLTCQVTMNGQTSVEGDASVYQQANSATYGAVSLTVTSPVSVDGGGGQYSITASGSQKVSFTSGASRAGSVSLSYAQASAVNGFSLNGSTVTASGNTTTSTKSYTVNVTATGEGSKKATKQVVFNQAAGKRTYSEITVNLSYPQASAAGGTVTPTVTYSQTWGWNGSTTGGGTITSGASVSYSGTNINSSTGVATVASKGTTVSGVTTATTATVTVSMNGKTAKKSAAVQQAANAATTITYGTPVVNLTVADISASGGTVSSGTVTYSQSRTQNYTSGATKALSAVTTGGQVSYSTAVTAPSLGTTVKSRTSVGTLTATVKLNGKSGSDSATVYQAANAKTTITYGNPVVNLVVADIPASGGSISSGTVTYSQSRTQNYTSGATSTLSALTTGGQVLYSAAVSGSNLGTTVKARTEVGTLTATVTMNGKSGSDSATVYQQANVRTETSRVINLSVPSGDISAGGGTKTVTRSGVINYGYTSGSTSTGSFTPTLSINGTGFSLDGVTVTAADRGTTVGARRTCTVTASYSGATSKSVEIGQQANSATYGNVTLNASNPATVAATGGTATISASASQTVSFTSGDTRSGSVSIAYAQNAPVSGFSLSGNKVTVTANNSTSARSYVVTVTATGEGSKSASKEVTVSQAAGAKTYSAITLNVSYPTIPAKGGTVTPTVTYSQTWGWNGSTTGGGTITSGATIAYSGTSVSTSNGAVTAGTKGTTVSGITTVTTATVKVTLNGKTASKQITVQQQANSATYGAVTISGGSVSDIPASGGSVSSMSGISASQTVSFTSGSTRPGSVSITYSTKVEADSLGTTVKNRASVGTLTATATGEGSKSATKSLTVYQAGNYVKSVDLTGFAIAYSKSVSAAGGTVSPSVTQGSVKFTFTSGSTSTSTPSSTYGSLASSITYSGSAANGFSAPNSSSGAMTVPGRGTTEGGARNSGTVTATKKVTWTHASSYSGGGTKTDSMTDTDYATQKANSATYTISLSANRYTTSSSPCPASGGTATISRSGSISYTSGSKGSFTPSISIQSAVSGASLSGTTLTWASRGTTVGNVRSVIVQATYSGATTKTVTIYQQANSADSISYGTPSVTLTVADIPASGGSVSSGKVSYSQSRAQVYTSGSTSPLSALTSGGSVSYSSAVSAPSLGTTVKERTAIGTLTVTVSMNGKSGSDSATVYQEANERKTGSISYGSWKVSVSANRYTTSSSPCPASGGTCTITRSASRTRTQNYSYTSGETSTAALSNETATPTLSISGTGASLSGTTVTWASRGTTVGEARQATVTATYSGVSATEIVYQQANSRTEVSRVISVSAPTGDIPAKGGSVTITRSGVINYSFTSGSTDTGSFTPSLAVSGTGFSISGTTVTAASRGTTVGERRSATVTASYSGATSKTVSVYQQANERTDEGVTYGKWQVSVSANRYVAPSSYCPASGGSATISRSASRTRTQNYSYTSGATSTSALSNETATPTLSISGTGASLSGTTVTFLSCGTTISGITNVTVFASYGGESAWVVLSQEANRQESTQLRCRYTTLDSVTSLDDFETCVLSDVGGDWEETSTGIDIPPFKIHSINSFSQPTFYFTFERCYSYTSGETSSWEIVPSADISFPTQDDFTEIVRDERVSFVSWVGHYSPWADFSSKTYVYFKCNIDNLVGASSDLIWLTMGYNRTDYKYVLAYATTPTPTRPTTYFELTSATTGEIQFPTMLGSAQGSMYFYFFALDDVTNDYSIIPFNKQILATLSPTLKGSVTRTVTYVRMTYSANTSAVAVAFGINISGELNFGSDAYCPFTFDSVGITFRQKAA